MKRVISVVLAFVLCLSMTGCCIKHEWKEATCLEPKTCSKCGRTEGDALGHDYSEWEIVMVPTYLTPGQQSKKCVRCNDTISEELPRLRTEGCKIIDDSGMNVTYEECYYLLEEVLSGNTSYMDLKHSFIFPKEDNKNIRFLKCDGTDTNVMVSILKNGGEPDPEDMIDYILITMVGSSSDINKKIPFLQACAISGILLTCDNLNNEDDALAFYNKVAKNSSSDNWIRNDKLEYLCDTASVGNDMYLVSFGIRVADQY